MYSARAAELLIVAGALAWAVFDCWTWRRYKDVVLGMLTVGLALGLAALAFYETSSN